MTPWEHVAAALKAPLLDWRHPAGKAPPKKILILGYAAIGDLIFFYPVLEGLRRAYPGAKFTFLANPYPTTQELLPASGLVDDIWLHDWEGPNAGDSRTINRRIEEERFDLAVLTLSSPAHYFQEGLASIPLRAGHLRHGGSLKRRLITGECSRRALLNRAVWLGPVVEHAVERNLKLLDALSLPRPRGRPGLPVPSASERSAKEKLGVPEGHRLGVHFGPPANQYGKIWEPEKLAALCARFGSLEVVALGGAEEQPHVDRARKVLPSLRSFVGQTSLLETFAALKTFSVFLSSDTGLAKAAMALGVPTVTVWGPTDPKELGACWEPQKHLDVVAGTPSVRWGMTVEGAVPSDALQNLSEEAVWRQVKPFLQQLQSQR